MSGGHAELPLAEGERADRRRASLGLRAGLVAATALLVAGGLWLRATAPEPVPVATESEKGIRVDTWTVETSALQPRVEVSGLVEARRRVELFAEHAGRVIETGAEALDRVDEGQLLVRLDPLQAEVEVARAEAALAQARSELALARTDLERRENLASSRVTSESELDRARNAERVAVATLRAAEASLRDARDRLAKRTLQAPFAGVLRAFHVEPDEYVKPGDPVAELLEVSRVRIEVGLRDRGVVALSPGATAWVEAEARPGERFQGVVTRVAGAADSRSRKFPVQIEIDNDSGRLLPGMVARVGLDLGERREVLLVPREVVLDEFGLPYVYVVESEGGTLRAWRRRLQVHDLPFEPGQLEVASGLATGERLVTTGLRQLRDGALVEARTVAGLAR